MLHLRCFTRLRVLFSHPRCVVHLQKKRDGMHVAGDEHQFLAYEGTIARCSAATRFQDANHETLQ